MANPNSPRSWLMGTIKSIIDYTDRIMLPQKYIFTKNREAAEFNTKLLKKEKYDLTKVLHTSKGSMMEPRSEFREKNELELLFHHHEHWTKMKAIISKGSDYPLTDLPDKVLKEDVCARQSQIGNSTRGCTHSMEELHKRSRTWVDATRHTRK